MSHTTAISDDGSVVRTEYAGEIGFEEMSQSYSERFTDPETVRKYKIVLSDYTQAKMLGLNAERVQVLAEMSLRAERMNPKVMVVGVMPNDLEFGLSRMWQAYASNHRWTSRVFRTRQEAEQFVTAYLKTNNS